MARVTRAIRVGAVSTVGLLIVATLALGAATQTRSGQAYILRQILTRVEGSVEGDFSVSHLTTPGLLRGVMLHDVRIDDPDGRSFLQADSVRASYSVTGMIRGSMVFSRVAIFRPRVVVEKLENAERYNAAVIFAPRRQEEDSIPLDTIPDGGRLVAVERVTIHDGEVVVRFPRGRPEEGLRALTFTGVNARLPWATFVDPDEEGQRLEIEDLSFTGQVLSEPFRIREASGELIIQPGSLRIRYSELDLPGSQGVGETRVSWGGRAGARVSGRYQARRLSTSDFLWLDSRLPEGSGSGVLGIEFARGELGVTFDRMDLNISEGRLQGSGVVSVGDRVALRGVDVIGHQLDLTLLSPWLPRPAPHAIIDGRATADGDLDDLAVVAQLTVQDPAGAQPPSFVDAEGTLHLVDRFGLSGFSARLDPFSYGWVSTLWDEMSLSGPGTANIQASGYLDAGVRFLADLTHRPAGLPASQVQSNGTVRLDSLGIWLDVEGDLHPLSFTAIKTYHPDLPVSGEVSGSVHARGPLEDLEITTDLETPAGALAFDATLDVTDPGAAYELEGSVEDFRLSRVLPDLPEPTIVTGAVSLHGQGRDTETIRGSARASLTRARVGTVSVDTAEIRLRAVSGVLHIDTLAAVTSLGQVSAGGTLGLRQEAPPGETLVEIESETLTDLAPYLIGRSLVAADTLTPLERDMLIFSGVDVDTLPTSEAIAVDGQVTSTVRLTGEVREFDADGVLHLQNGLFRADYIRNGDVTFTATGLPDLTGEIRATVAIDSIRVRDRLFRRVEADLDYSSTGGGVNAFLVRNDDEDYRIRIDAEWDSAGGAAHIDELTLRFDSLRWNLGGPSTVSWSPQGVEVRDFRLIRPGLEGMRMEADGVLPRSGPVDFTLSLQRLDLGKLSRVAQLRDPITGELDFSLRVQGDAARPVATGSVRGSSLVWTDFQMGLVEGEVGYDDRQVRTDLQAWDRGRQVFAVQGFMPAFLSLSELVAEIPEDPLELRISVDSLPAALPLAPLHTLQEVEGTITGQVHLGGTPRDIQPTGRLQLDGGETALPDLGVRYTDAHATLNLFASGVVEVEGALQNGGPARVTGAMDMSLLTNPQFSLTITTEDFLAVRRRDIEGRVSGSVQLQNTYRRPYITGQMRVEEGVMFVEEFARTAQVVDLADPAFFDVVDTTLVPLRPVLRGTQNPFLRNLRVAVDLEVGRNTWLRSRDMNVEIGGDLIVTWDRTSKDLAMVGELEAIRGRYNVFGRQFQVQTGTVSFLGTPGINPNLEIEALNRLRTPYLDEPMNIFADVSGTLLAPRVGLRSDTPLPIAESDLVSYLIFGRPTYALASGQSAIVEGAAGSILGAATGAGVTLGLGVISSQLGSVVARDIGIDYFAITQGQDVSPFTGGNVSGSLAESAAWTEVELGQYVRENVFVAVMLRPFSGVLGSTSQRHLAGVRMEWKVGDLRTVEGFIEDRFARNRVAGFGNLGFNLERVAGFFFYQEWGY